MSIEKPEIKPEPKPLIMTISLHPTEGCKVAFPMMNDKIITYGTLRVAEKALDEFYGKQNKIVQPKGNIMDFARRKFK